jgi:tetratricopeptide (TPR) repeat protein
VNGLLRARRRFPAALALGLVLAVALPARADERIERARAHYLQGNAYYKLDKFKEALGEYEQAYIAKPDPSFIFNIAQCHRLMGNRMEAVKFYRRYLEDQPVSPNRPVAEKHIRDLEWALANQLAAPSDSPSDLPSDSPSDSPSPSASAPGGSPAAAPVVALPAVSAAPGPASGSLSTASAPDSGSGAVYRRWWFWTAAAVVAVAVTGVVIGLALRDDQCDPGRICM